MKPFFSQTGVDLYLGKCEEVLRELEPESVSACVTDPPYGLGEIKNLPGLLEAWMNDDCDKKHIGKSGFMNREWDAGVPSPRYWKEVYRVMKPGAHLLCFASTRTWDLMSLSIRLAGFENRDTIRHDYGPPALGWLQGAGFPKAYSFATRYKDGFCNCEVSGKAVPDTHDNETPEHHMRLLQSAHLSETEPDEKTYDEVLQYGLSEQSLQKHGASRPESKSGRREQPGVEGRDIHRAGKGLRDGAQSDSSEGTPERVCVGTHPSSGEDAWAPTESGRGSASHEPGQSGQSTGELTDLRESSGALDDRTLCNGGGCPRCGKLKAEFKGFASALKPAWEVILVFRRPLEESSIARQVLSTGTGAINIDASRVQGHSYTQEQWTQKGASRPTGTTYGGHRGSDTPLPSGRFPANLLLSHVSGPNGCQRVGTKRVRGTNPGTYQRADAHAAEDDGEIYGKMPPRPQGFKVDYADPDGYEEIESFECARDEEGNYICPVALLDLQSGTRPAGYRKNPSLAKRGDCLSTYFTQDYTDGERGYKDSGGASRYFQQFHEPDTGPGFLYQAKASERDRTANGRVENHHNTVKPTELMKWLCKLVGIPGGTILDPFLGSGTTGVACVELGFDFIGIEQDESYLEVAAARISHAGKEEPPKPKPLKVASSSLENDIEAQLNLFEEGA